MEERSRLYACSRDGIGVYRSRMCSQLIGVPKFEKNVAGIPSGTQTMAIENPISMEVFMAKSILHGVLSIQPGLISRGYSY